MRILVTGASGFIGRTCLRVLGGHDLLGTYRSRPKPGLVALDLLDREQLRARFAAFRPDAVIHCAARPSVDWCELHQEDGHRLNVEATLGLLAECERAGARVAFLSTDYVFDGAAGPYDEAAAPRPINAYGRFKLEAERAILAGAEAHLVARTTNVYGFDPGSKNFLMAILPDLARGQIVRVASDQYGTPTLVEDLCIVIGELLVGRARGLFHVVGPELMNRVDWGRAAAQAFGFNPDLVVGVPTEELDQAAPRPKHAGLVSTRLAEVTHSQLRPLAAGLAKMVAERAASGNTAW
jgi:dTDP-4-dehydrorhamnose reductase